MIIAVDIDAVCADLAPAWLAAYNRDYHDSLTPEQLKDWGIVEFVKPECGAKIFYYLDNPSFYDRVEAIEGAREYINALRMDGHRIIFVTSSPPSTYGRKFQWLVDKGFIEHDVDGLESYFEARDKSMIRADILLDDGYHNVETFPGVGELFNQPWNLKYDHPHRVESWREFYAGVMSCRFLHPTERIRPLQAQRFREIVDQMYQVHLDKNADYSPANILATGEIGLATRLWDKMARLLNLVGFRIEIASARYEEPREPKNESVDDTLMDMAVYAIIGKLLREGVWGK